VLIANLVSVARELNPGVRILAHVAGADEAALLQQSLQIEALWPQAALAEHMVTWATAAAGAPPGSTEAAVQSGHGAQAHHQGEAHGHQG
jgi:hypothetical protein